MRRRTLLGGGLGLGAGAAAATLFGSRPATANEAAPSGVPPTRQTEAEPAGLPTRYVIPGDRAFPGGLAYDRRTGTYWTGSTADGTLFVGSIREPAATVWKPAGSDGRTVTAGLGLDEHGRLYVAGGSVPAVWIYDTRTGALLARLDTTEGGFTNEIAVTPDGIYVTDSYVPVIYRILDRGGRFRIERWRDLSGTPIEYDGTTVALNGIVGAARWLLSVHSSQGRLFRIERNTGAVTEVDLDGRSLSNGDGLLVRDQLFYVVQGNLYDGAEQPRVTVLRMTPEYDRVLRSGELTGGLLHPSAVQLAGGRMLVVNSQYNRFLDGDEPVLPFTISVLEPDAR